MILGMREIDVWRVGVQFFYRHIKIQIEMRLVTPSASISGPQPLLRGQRVRPGLPTTPPKNRNLELIAVSSF